MVVLIMGVSGSGKTTVGKKVAHALKVPFVDADDLHSNMSISKMKKGIPLTDEDRVPWLKRVAEKMVQLARRGGGVVACSALKADYRRMLLGDATFSFLLVYLKGTRHTLYRRLRRRKEHFMGPDLLESQLRTLEEPDSALTLSIEFSPQTLCEKIVHSVAH